MERCALKAADRDVLVRGRSHGLILLANLARPALLLLRKKGV